MKYCLSEYMGSGTENDPYRPLGVEDGMEFAGIDLRPISTILDGFCIVAYPDDAVLPKRVMQISSYKTEKLGNPSKTIFANKIGLNIDSINFDEILLELLTTHSTPPNDKSRWNPIAPTKEKRFEIWIGEKVVDIPFVSGGSTYTESFNKSDSTTLGPDLTWTALHDDLQVVSNKVTCVNTATVARERAGSDCAGNDNYAQIVIINRDAGATSSIEAISRYQSSANTGYPFRHTNNTVHEILMKIEAGSLTTISSVNGATPAANDIVKSQSNGSTISAHVNGVQQTSVTDTSITTGLRGGVGMTCVNGPSTWTGDSFEYGDISVSATTTPSTISRSFAINTPGLNSLHAATVITRSFAVNAPTVTAASVALPSTIARSWAINAPTIDAQSYATPGTVALAFTMPAPTVTGDSVAATTTDTDTSRVITSRRRRGSTIGKTKTI